MSTQVAPNEYTDIETIERVGIEVSAAGALAKSEVEAQLDAAHKYPRSVKRFLNEAITLATHNKEIAASCMYAVPRGGKVIEGPSIRMAEICISAYGNLHVGARVIGAEEKEVISQGVCWDLEKNNRITIEKRRKIFDKNGRRFNDDMINVTGNAAASIALRDAAFRIIPRTFVDIVYEAARKVAVGEASTLAARRDEVFQKLVKMGAMPDRILARIGKAAIEDIGIAEMQVLIGFGTAIHSGAEKVDDIFPAPTVEKGKVDLETLKAGAEDNRGHGKDNLAQVKTEAAVKDKEKTVKAKPDAVKAGAAHPPQDQMVAGPAAGNTIESQRQEKAAEASAVQAETSATDEAPLTDAQTEQLETERTRNSVDFKVFKKWAMEAFDVKMISNLRQKHFARCLAWTMAGGQEGPSAN